MTVDELIPAPVWNAVVSLFNKRSIDRLSTQRDGLMYVNIRTHSGGVIVTATDGHALIEIAWDIPIPDELVGVNAAVSLLDAIRCARGNGEPEVLSAEEVGFPETDSILRPEGEGREWSCAVVWGVDPFLFSIPWRVTHRLGLDTEVAWTVTHGVGPLNVVIAWNWSKPQCLLDRGATRVVTCVALMPKRLD